jgi:hypothetical protein
VGQCFVLLRWATMRPRAAEAPGATAVCPLCMAGLQGKEDAVRKTESMGGRLGKLRCLRTAQE